MWFQPRHVVALAAIAATATVLQPVAAQAAGSLVTLVGGPGDYHAVVTPAGELVVSPTANVLQVYMAGTIAPGTTVLQTTSPCRVTQVYAYPYPAGKLPADPDASTLTTGVYLPRASLSLPARSLTLASWDSGTPAGTGVIHALTRTAVQQTLRVHVGKGSYSWFVWIYCMR